jgi:hypothetical protein
MHFLSIAAMFICSLWKRNKVGITKIKVDILREKKGAPTPFRKIRFVVLQVYTV